MKARDEYRDQAETFLKVNHPVMYRQLRLSGELEAMLDDKADRAVAMAAQVAAQMSVTDPPPESAKYLDRVQHFQSHEMAAAEIAMAEVVNAL